MLKRRINNAILTIYLPTILILIIVYATNFFKDFFFEAVVTVNLTSLLVLTTLFISVSQSLPPTAYVKMIDIWLIPFVEVLLHSYMDLHRVSEDREINHHGKTLKVEDEVDTNKQNVDYNLYAEFNVRIQIKTWPTFQTIRIWKFTQSLYILVFWKCWTLFS